MLNDRKAKELWDLQAESEGSTNHFVSRLTMNRIEQLRMEVASEAQIGAYHLALITSGVTMGIVIQGEHLQFKYIEGHVVHTNVEGQLVDDKRYNINHMVEWMEQGEMYVLSGWEALI